MIYYGFLCMVITIMAQSLYCMEQKIFYQPETLLSLSRACVEKNSAYEKKLPINFPSNQLGAALVTALLNEKHLSVEQCSPLIEIAAKFNCKYDQKQLTLILKNLAANTSNLNSKILFFEKIPSLTGAFKKQS